MQHISAYNQEILGEQSLPVVNVPLAAGVTKETRGELLAYFLKLLGVGPLDV